jgi:hypothetical protein
MSDERRHAEAYPLQWPQGWPRTKVRAWPRWKSCSVHKATNEVLEEVRRLGGSWPIISSNVELRQDGLPYANRRDPNDPGVAVYFFLKGKQRVIPCDAWHSVGDNLHAIAKSIDAMRGIERWGAKTILDRALNAFDALPAPAQWWDVLGLFAEASVEEIRARRVELARKYHPDSGTEPDCRRMADINAAADRALQERG